RVRQAALQSSGIALDGGQHRLLVAHRYISVHTRARTSGRRRREREVATGENDLTGNGLPTTARAVVIGAGIAGNCLVYHLARLGWKDLVLLDKGPLPNPGGSTGHASNFIFPVDHSKEMTSIKRDSAR